jgi:ASC-1-like (ASCH) protein
VKVEWDKQIERGQIVNPNAYMASITEDMTKMYKVLKNILPNQSIENIFGEVFRHIVKAFEDFYMNLNLVSKYGRKRLKVDLNSFMKKIQLLEFENKELINMVV